VPLAQIFSSYRQLAERAQQLEREAEELRLQARALESERSGLQARVRQSEKDILEYKQREIKLKDDARQAIALTFERDELRHLHDELKAENTALQKEIEESRNEADLQKERLWAPPGHVYSPITDPNDAFVRETGIANLDALKDRPDLPVDEKAQLRLLGWLGEHGSRFPFQTTPEPDWRFITANGHFGQADAALFFSMLLEYKPAHLVEIGCGFSSLLIMDVNDHFLDQSMQVSFFDPRPDAILAMLTPLDAYRERVRSCRSQEIGAEIFAQLGRGDILSLETSHVGKTGSDVCDILFRILPALAPGVLVHIHDVYYPFEYPPAWAVQDNRSWNGAYMLRAFLEFNSSFRVLYFNDLMVRKYPEQTQAAFPGLEDMQASSLWIEKTA